MGGSEVYGRRIDIGMCDVVGGIWALGELGGLIVGIVITPWWQRESIGIMVYQCIYSCCRNVKRLDASDS